MFADNYRLAFLQDMPSVVLLRSASFEHCRSAELSGRCDAAFRVQGILTRGIHAAFSSPFHESNVKRSPLAGNDPVGTFSSLLF